MKTSRMFIPALMAMLLGLVFAFGPGCEDDPDTQELANYLLDNPDYLDTLDKEMELAGDVVRIIPASASVPAQGTSVSFKARGGEGPYTWSLANGNGIINITKTDENETVIYTDTAKAANTIRVVDRDGNGSTAQIEVGNPVALQIIPIELTMDDNGAAYQFNVVGGVPPYTWNVGAPAAGGINATGLYTPIVGQTATSTVTVADSAGVLSQATFIQNL